MSLQVLTYLVVGATFILYIGIAVWARAGSTDEFYVAGGGVHPVANGMATAADWMSAASFISMAGAIAFMGYGGSVFLMGWTGGYVLLALLLAPYLRKFGHYTVPDFVGDRYESTAARLVAVVCAIFVSFTYVAGQMRGVGIVFSRFLATGATDHLRPVGRGGRLGVCSPRLRTLGQQPSGLCLDDGLQAGELEVVVAAHVFVKDVNDDVRKVHQDPGPF